MTRQHKFLYIWWDGRSKEKVADNEKNDFKYFRDSLIEWQIYGVYWDRQVCDLIWEILSEYNGLQIKCTDSEVVNACVLEVFKQMTSVRSQQKEFLTKHRSQSIFHLYLPDLFFL
jgi:hypothetical protein